MPWKRSIWGDLLAVAALVAPAAALFLRSRRLGTDCAALLGPLDARFVEYVLEWGYLHLQGLAGADGSLWSPPFFYPVRNVLAFSENFFSAYPFYFPLRWTGLDPASALFVFHLLQLALTPVVAYLCLRSLHLGRWPALVGAALFSWTWIRYYHFGHIQFAAGYPIPLFFTALYFAVNRRQPWAAVLAAWTFLFAWHMSLYTAIFLVLGMLALGLAQVVVPGGARELWNTARSYGRFARARPRQAAACLALCLTALALVAPSAAIYAEAHEGFGPAPRAEVRNYWGDVLSWIRPPPQHPFLGRFYQYFSAESGGVWEKKAFLGWLGFLGLILPGAAFLVRGRRIYSLWPRSLVVVSGAASGVILVFSNYGGLWPETPFWLLHEHFPGLGGLRAPTRIAFVVSWFTALCLAGHLERFAVRSSVLGWLASGGLGLALLAESLAPLPPVVDRCGVETIWTETEDSLCPQIPRDEVGTVLFLPAGIYSISRVEQHTLAMHFSLSCGLNVINGYSGRQPELIAPLLGPDPWTVPCPALREVLDRVHERSGKGVLIHVDLGPTVGLPDYPVAAVRECLAPCLAPEPDWFTEQPGRPAEILVTDPRGSCGVAAAS